MGSGLNNVNLVFIVNDMDVLETLCKYIQRMGFSITDASNPEDFLQDFNTTSVPIKRISSTGTKKDLHLELFNMLRAISSEANSVLLALQDLSLLSRRINMLHN